MTSADIGTALLIAGTLLCLGMFPLRPQSRLLPGPDPALWRAIVLAGLGLWRPAARLMAQTGQDWDRRALYAEKLARAGGWLWPLWVRAWERAHPGDPDAALIRAQAQVSLAWRLRRGNYANQTASWRFRLFHRALSKARQNLSDAARLNPDDPCTYSAEIWPALGLGYSEDMMRELWEEIAKRAPHHFQAHYNALQYWSEKWRGSHEKARVFAGQAADGAPAGTLMATLPLFAWYEMYEARGNRHDFRSPEVRAMVDTALADMEAAAGHPALPYVQHLVAYCLTKQGRHREALRHFRAVDGWVGSVPWRYKGYQRLAYRGVRTAAVRGAVIDAVRRRLRRG
ncbi:hypothetical protein [Streptomyces lateritius]|uniref:hypothetical protein n=1 Tax=Streptomyces lateritius TaxID=67313 RepID=UPI0016759459|nr:hypothetical protein [Streptomyces lateritius]GGU12668.1 hypothetical protein GCM10010272_67310 [Streptomyces lateritius]